MINEKNLLQVIAHSIAIELLVHGRNGKISHMVAVLSWPLFCAHKEELNRDKRSRYATPSSRARMANTRMSANDLMRSILENEAITRHVFAHIRDVIVSSLDIHRHLIFVWYIYY